MALPGLRALKQLMRRGSGQESPPASWSRPFGLGWEKPYTVRYASNLDDGPWHGAPWGALAPAAWAAVPGAISTFGTWMAANIGLAQFPTVNSPCLRTTAKAPRPMP